MWRHGDVLVARVDSIPADAERLRHSVLAEGEVTGHSHRLEVPESAVLMEHSSGLYLRVVAEHATLIHEEHHPIVLPRGEYRVWQQREYTPSEIRTVRD